jgi:thiol:disulfide interchange protein DsbA
MKAWLAALFALFVAQVAVVAAAEEFEAGAHYEVLPIPVETATPGKIEVVEVFSYACGGCFGFDPVLQAWRQTLAGDVAFRRVPAVFRDDWKIFAQAFYAAEALGVGDKVHQPLFDAIHLRGLDLRDPKLLAGVFKDAAGVDEDEFIRVLNSFGVRSKTLQADAQGRMYRVTGVPTMIVDGKYRVYGGMLQGSNVRVLTVVDFLLDKIRSERKPE